MNIRRERSHRCGHTNIDFRTKNDLDSIKTFMPWKTKKDFGTMGNNFYTLPYDEKKKIMKATENLNSNKNIHDEIPDPKYYKTAQFYQTNNIQIKKKLLNNDERIAQLDESFKGKEKFTGESMMISDLTKQRKLRKDLEKEKLMKIKNMIGEEEGEEEGKKKAKLKSNKIKLFLFIIILLNLILNILNKLIYLII
jgi:hypothetical protein